MSDQGQLAPQAAAPGFAVLYQSQYRSIRALAWALTGDPGIAEDVTQEAFLRAHVRWSTISSYDEPGAWVRRVAINLATSFLRRRSRELRALVRFGSEPAREWVMPDGDQRFWSEVRRLPRRQAAVIALHYYEDLPVSDIATVLELAEGTVKAHLSRGRKNLSRALGIEPQP